jgi:hypothetical protein
MALRWLAEEPRLEQGVPHSGAWAAGLKAFPSARMQRAKIATQSPADE